jgi:ribonuclease VapC
VIVDASALLAVALGEPEILDFTRVMDGAPSLRISSVNYLEAAIKVDGSGKRELIEALRRTIDTAGIITVAVTPQHAELAREAYRRFGKGNHKARLNLGDCFAYALAKESGEALLFKGNDFRQTDIQSAL